jgi:hypothetical protein
MGKPEGKGHWQDQDVGGWRRWVDNIKMVVREM